MTAINAVKDDNSRITARAPKQVRDKLQKAADLSGSTLSQFLVAAALKEAERVIERENIVRIDAQRSTAFLSALETPPAANKRLVDAVKAYRKAM